MTRMSISLVGTVLGLSLLGPAAARADLITWSFNWSGSPTTVPADAGGTGGVFLLDPQPGHGQGSLEIKGTQLQLFSAAPAGMLDKLTNKPYSLDLSLTDGASQKSGKLTFTGLLNGSFSSSQANILNTFTGKTTKVLLLGRHLYTVFLDKFIPPSPTSAGEFDAHVSIATNFRGYCRTNGGGGSGTGSGGGGPHAPEPSSLLLAGLGLTSLVAMFRKKSARGNSPATAKT